MDTTFDKDAVKVNFNEFGHKGYTYQKALTLGRYWFRILDKLKLENKYRITIMPPEESDFGDVSHLMIMGPEGKFRDDKILEHLVFGKPSEMTAWQVYLLMTSYTILPCYDHGGYCERKFIFHESDLLKIDELYHVDRKQIPVEVLEPAVMLSHEGNKTIASVFCCYWNDWKGLVCEEGTVTFSHERITDFKLKDQEILYSYDCGFLF